MKLNLLNIINPSSIKDNTCYMYWKCSLYERDNKNVTVRKCVGFSGNCDILHKTVNLSLSMKSHQNVIEMPIITLQSFNNIQNEFMYMKSI